MTGQGRAMQLLVTTQSEPTEVGQIEVYPLIVFDAAGTAVLLEPEGDEYRLPRVKIPQVPGYLRSLARKMKQEADSIQKRRVECPL